MLLDPYADAASLGKTSSSSSSSRPDLFGRRRRYSEPGLLIADAHTATRGRASGIVGQRKARGDTAAHTAVVDILFTKSSSYSSYSSYSSRDSRIQNSRGIEILFLFIFFFLLHTLFFLLRFTLISLSLGCCWCSETVTRSRRSRTNGAKESPERESTASMGNFNTFVYLTNTRVSDLVGPTHVRFYATDSERSRRIERNLELRTNFRFENYIFWP